MEDVLVETVLSQETLDKAREVYSVMIDKLYTHFVVNKGEARPDTITAILSALSFVVMSHSEKDSDKDSSMEEVDLI